MIEPIFRKVCARAPATVANVGPGFDSFGLCLECPCDEVSVELLDGREGLVFLSIQGDNGLLPLDIDKNTAGVAVRRFCEHLGVDLSLGLSLKKNLPLKSGLGSSAASSVAALTAVNRLFGSPLERKELLPFLMDAEEAACGARHADNVAPCLYGGFVIVREALEPDVIQIPIPEDVFVSIVHPHIEISTRQAREVLPQLVPLSVSVGQGANMASLIAGMFKRDYPLIGRSLTDLIAEPVRKALIPFFDSVKACALAKGALGFGISGSGPSLFALCQGQKPAQEVNRACVSFLEGKGISADGFSVRISPNGGDVFETVGI